MSLWAFAKTTVQTHRKPTKPVSSSQALISRIMGMGCKGRPEHVAVMGGAKVTRPAGRYTQSFATAMVSGLTDQFDHETALMQVHEPLAADASLEPKMEDDPLSSDGEAKVPSEVENAKIPTAI